MNIPTSKLKSGNEIPVIGIGTWRLSGDVAFNTVRTALQVGYKHIDTAEHYQNHAEVRKAIEGFERKDIFITTKLWRDFLKHDDAIKECDRALTELGTDYVDLYLLHWPNPEIPMTETMQAMQELKDAGKIKSIGVSNFTIRHLEEALATGVEININQVEFHPYLYQKELLEFCKSKGIAITAYCPLGQGEAVQDKTIIEIANKLQKTPAQIALKWLVSKGIIAIPKSTKEEHLKQNLDLFSWELPAEESEKIDSIEKNKRMCDYFDNFD